MLRIANGQGFWGDSVDAPARLVEEGPLDVLTLDYLAEVTMSILQKLKSRDPRAGYATDFVDMKGLAIAVARASDKSGRRHTPPQRVRNAAYLGCGIWLAE